MKTFVVLAVSIVLVSILFCPMAMAAPPMPNDVQMVEPDPSLPKELAAFCGKWEGLRWVPNVVSNRRENRRGKGRALSLAKWHSEPPWRLVKISSQRRQTIREIQLLVSE